MVYEFIILCPLFFCFFYEFSLKRPMAPKEKLWAPFGVFEFEKNILLVERKSL